VSVIAKELNAEIDMPQQSHYSATPCCHKELVRPLQRKPRRFQLKTSTQPNASLFQNTNLSFVALKRAVGLVVDLGVYCLLLCWYFARALVPSEIACFDSSPGRMRRVAAWTSFEPRKPFFA